MGFPCGLWVQGRGRTAREERAEAGGKLARGRKVRETLVGERRREEEDPLRRRESRRGER